MILPTSFTLRRWMRSIGGHKQRGRAVLLALLASACTPATIHEPELQGAVPVASSGVQSTGSEATPSGLAQVALGARLFQEPRFSQAFFVRCAGGVNADARQPDPKQDAALPPTSSTISCADCHVMGRASEPLGQRAFADHARRSPVPRRQEDDQRETLRNSPSLVGATLGGPHSLHFDGEFPSAERLVIDTLLGRNHGWLAAERQRAIAHIARVVREDDGSDDLGREYGGSYAQLLSGAVAVLPARLPLPRSGRLDVASAGDGEILDALARLVAAFLTSLDFARDEQGAYSGSPYDAFLRKNGLPLQPAADESDRAYGRRLLVALEDLESPLFLDEREGVFESHPRPFAFGPSELTGLAVFLREPGPGAPERSGIGNCAACHPPPGFTDFSFHNTGASEEEYDEVHEYGDFLALRIPTLAQRSGDHPGCLPPTRAHPDASGRFAARPTPGDPARLDLGLWNVLANPDLPASQERLEAALIRQLRLEGVRGPLSPEVLLEHSIARFKTPGLRDLGHSDPYLHGGNMDGLEDVVDFYWNTSLLARSNLVRNIAPEIADMHVSIGDRRALVSFLEALDEDYVWPAPGQGRR